MNPYLKTILWLLFFIANCYAVKYSFAGMSYSSDLTFYLGLVGLVLLIVTDFLILTRVFNKHQPKGEEK